ncbi:MULTISPECIES: DUF6093 family protein [unclassified Microbacterium]|uniref:DUF6093 family protein n=1 Tax=unclassified Microbacterium TaxID=2609290 RepID=UPI00386D14AE
MNHLEVLARARARANERMSEAVKVGKAIRRTDTETRKAVAEITSPRYAGPGRIKYESLATSERDVPGQPSREQAPYLSIPTGSPRCFEGEEVHVDASDADESLAGRQYKIAGSPVAGQTSSHRYPLIELT